MAALIWAGAAVSLAGVVAILWCVLYVWRARRAGLPEEVLRQRLQRAVALNLGAFLVSALGLMLVVAGIFLG